ncbi:MAG: L-lysine 6-transaminase [Candidatus Coatesbacteria bacterium]|nr:MAG: L-lysine 6-transaminase [Candidatus Coatesbacteria bacterium]
MEKKDVLNILHKHILMDGFADLIVDLERSEGGYIVDAITGKRYVDFFSYFASCPVGYNHPKMHDSEFKEKLLLSAIHKPSNSDFYTYSYAEFVEAMERYAQPDGMPYMFFIDGGALAVENALKTAFDFKTKRNIEKGIWSGSWEEIDKRHSNDLKVICFDEGFHGRSGYTISITRSADIRKTAFFPKFNWYRVKNPKIHFPLTDEEVERVAREENEAISDIKKIINEEKDRIAAIIIEPIQGEGGDNHFRGEFFKQLREITKEEDIFLIYDEIQTGMGMTGEMWGYQNFGEDVRPDIITFGKKFQVAGIIVSEKVEAIDYHVFSDKVDEKLGFAPGVSRLNSTFGGNLTDMVRATQYLKIIDEEELIEKSREMGEYMLDRLIDIGKRYRDYVDNIRGRGLMIAFDLKTVDMRDKLFNCTIKNGLLLLKCGEKSIRFRPHLDITKEIADEGLDILDRSMKETLL